MILRKDEPRRVLPRWRSPAEAFAANEGRALPLTGPSSLPSTPGLVEREAEWLENPTRGVALDLISVASITPLRSPVAREAAESLVREGRLTPTSQRVIKVVLHPPTLQARLDLPPIEEMQSEVAKTRVRDLRRSLVIEPRNALAWSEQARAYVQIGQIDPAKRAMQRALALAPHHRYLLRAAARLAIHAGEHDRAHWLLMENPRTPYDPWLVATEIAVADLAGQRSCLVNAGKRLLLPGSWSPANLTELESSLGTLELGSGSTRRARDLFLQSLDSPNDNALAQAEAVGNAVPRVRDRLRDVAEDVPRSYEAKSLAAAHSGDHAVAIKEAESWLADQPFSTDPATFGSYQAAEIRDYVTALNFAERGAAANPQDLVLRNNAAFALAKLDRPADARMRLHGMNPDRYDGDTKAMILATSGLIALRESKIEVGQELYLQAISSADSATNRALAQIMLLSELLRLRLPGADAKAASLRSRVADALPRHDRDWLGHLSD